MVQKSIVDENCALEDINPQSPYAATKYKEELLVREYFKEKNLKTVTLRLGSICGISPGMRFHAAISKFCYQAATNQPLSVWETALKQKRPFLSLNDATKAIAFVIQNNLFDGGVFNLVTSNYSVEEIIEIIKKNVPNIKVELVKSKIMNDLSYDVSSKKFKDQGFIFSQNLEEGIKIQLNCLNQLTKMELNKSFTLVLLIKGRHEFTYRWLIYMNKINFKYPILIGDGQNDDETMKMIKKININKNLDITYYRYDTHSGYLDYYKMKNDILSKVKTKFVMLCDNDDFILPSGLNDQINFLSKNNDYISASGRILNFEIDGYDYVCYGRKPTFLEPCSYFRLEEPLSNWSEQIKSVFTKFQPNFYNVFQTKELKIISDELIDLNFSDLVINEFYIQLRASTLGKSKILTSSFHYLRQRGTSSISKNYEFSNDILKKICQKM